VVGHDALGKISAHATDNRSDDGHFAVPRENSSCPGPAPMPAFPASVLWDRGQLAVEGIEVGRDPSFEVARGHLVTDIDRTRKAESVRAAVAFDCDAFEAKKHAPIDAARVHPVAEGLKTGPGELGADLGHQRLCHSFTEIDADLARGALGCLERDSAGEAFDDDH